MSLVAAVATVRRRRCLLVARAHAVLAGRVPAPAVRRRPPLAFGTQVFRRPVLVRRLFGDAARDVVGMLAAGSLDEATAIAAQVARRRWDPAAARALRELRALARGEAGALWGDSAAVDALRLRHLRAGSEPAPPAITWGRFLSWAGHRLEGAPLAKLPPALARVATASVAAVRGYRGAFEALAMRSRAPAALAEPLALVALRCALEGVFLPHFVACLMPRTRRRDAEGFDPWAPALLALHAYHAHHNVAGVVHLTAALASADVRERLVAFAGREASAVLRRRWGAPVPPEADRALQDAVLLLRVRAHQVERFFLNPWPRGWGGPDVTAAVGAVDRLLGRKDAGLGFEVFLDDRLAVAALFAAIGYGPSAHAQLAQAEVRPALREAHHALAAAPAPPLADLTALLPEQPWNADGERAFQRLRATPEPSVELGSPHWMLGETRGGLMSRLMAEGRFETARAVRPLLDRQDLQHDLTRFWILRGTAEDSAAVAGLAAWLAARERTALSEDDWLRVAEDTCRRQQAEEEG
jgi:hypothetical protein